MTLSIIIVNYNVRHLLEKCLESVRIASGEIDSEIIVVDNNSTDGSREYFPKTFTNINYQYNNENLGFAKACNQGLRDSKGQFVLFLNPDTIVSQDCLQKCISFFNSHPEAGAVGVRMVDGNGKFLKESKRGFPSPTASFYKLFGLAGLFPKSKLFSQYYLGHLKENETHEIDVLSGAFMMIRNDVLKKIKGFDDSFFMYGEDIDISYRIKQEGYKKIYLGDITITHMKGKSTPLDLKYVNSFYNAMIIFVKKHYSNNRSPVFLFILFTGIRFRKLLAILGYFIKKITGNK